MNPRSSLLSHQEATDDIFAEFSDGPRSLHEMVSDNDLDVLMELSPGEEIDESIESVRHLLERVRAVELPRRSPASRERRGGRGHKVGSEMILNGMQECEARIAMAVDIGSDIPADIRIVGAEGEYAEGSRTETVTEPRTIVLSESLPAGTHPELWTTNIAGLGKVTMWFEGGVNVGANGISSGGSCWWMKFDDGPFKLLLAELHLEGPNAKGGHLRIQHGGDYIREANGSPKTFPLAPSVNLGGHQVSLLDEGQKGGPGVFLKSLTVEVTVTREVQGPIGPDPVIEDQLDATPQDVAAALQAETGLNDVTVRFENFGVGRHPESDLTKEIHSGMPLIRFVGDGGIEVLENGSIASLAQGRGRGDWAFLPVQPIDVKDITIRVTGGTGGRIHMKTLTSDEWLDVGSGGTFPVNLKNVTEFSASTPDGLRLIFESLTMQGVVTKEAVTQQAPEEGTESPLERQLRDLEALAAPWSLEGASDALQALEERGTTLAAGTKDFDALVSSVDEMCLPEEDTTLQTRLSTVGTMLSASVEEWTITREDVLMPGSAVDTLGAEALAGFETTEAKAALALPSLGGTASLQSWQGVLNNLSSMGAEVSTLHAHGSAFTIDLSGAEHLVTNVSFTVASDNPGQPITVRFYRGSQLIGLQTVASGSAVDFSDAEGITGMVMANAMREMSPRAREFLEYYNTADGQFWEGRMSGGAAVRYFYNHPDIPEAERSLLVSEARQGFLPYDLSVSDLEIAGNAYLPQAEASPLSIANNADLARAAHPYWGQSEDTLRRGPSPGYLALGRFAPNAYGIRRDANQYSAVRFMGTNGTVKITNVAYHGTGGDAPLSPEYYEIVGSTVIFRPGAPEQEVIYFGKEDGGDPQGINIDVEHRQSLSGDNLLPPEGMSVRSNILAIRGGNTAEGVGSALTEIRSTERPVTISSGNVLLNVWNDGRSGGTVRVITNPGTPGLSEISLPLGPGEGKSVSMNFVVPTDGQLKIRIVLPDGTVIDDGQTLKTEGDLDEKRIVIREANGTYRLLWVALNDPRPTVSDAPSYDPGYAAWIQEYIARTNDPSVADPANFGKTFIAYVESKNPRPLAGMEEELEKFIDEHGDILTVLNRVSLTRIREDAILGLESATLRDNRKHIEHFTFLKEAAEGLLNDMNDPRADEWKAYIQKTTSDPELRSLSSQLRYGTVTSANPKNLTEHMRVDRLAGGFITFELKEKMMVNLSVDMSSLGLLAFENSMPILPNISLQLKGTRDAGENIDWKSDKRTNSGESISAMLDAGTYTLTIQDKTTYPNSALMTTEQRAKLHLPLVPVSVGINGYNSADIQGHVSIEGNSKVMPVSMRVAEFISDGKEGLKRNINYDLDSQNGGVNKLDPSKPIWVVIHGRTDRPDSNNINELTEKLFALSGQKYQVVTVDWEKAAADIFKIPFPLTNGIDVGDLDNAMWTPAVGKWIGQQLASQGFPPSKVFFATHSHASFSGFFAAEWLMEHSENHEKVGGIIALDSAKNPPFFGADIPSDSIVFKNVAMNSLAIHSSILGSKQRAFGADRAITVTSNNWSPFKEHGYAVTVFADILDDIKNGKNTPLTSHFDFSPEHGFRCSPKLSNPEGYDAWIDVATEGILTEDGAWWKAKAAMLRPRLNNGTWGDPVYDSALEWIYANGEFPSSADGSYLP